LVLDISCGFYSKSCGKTWTNSQLRFNYEKNEKTFRDRGSGFAFIWK